MRELHPTIDVKGSKRSRQHERETFTKKNILIGIIMILTGNMPPLN